MDYLKTDSPHARRMMILQAVVEDYIRSNEPVSSASVLKHHHLSVSPATIRNDMAALEKEGYLIQPHTSAGRIPSEKGYRYFVNGLASIIPLSLAQRRAIQHFLSGSVNLQDTLQRSARLLASITGQVALVTAPSLSRSHVRHIEFVQVACQTLMVIVITDAGDVAQHILPGVSLSGEQLRTLMCVVNEQCEGCSLPQAVTQMELLAKRNEEEAATRTIFVKLADALQDMHNGQYACQDLYIAGTSQLAHQYSIPDIAELFDALEEQAVMMRLITSLGQVAGETVNGVSVAIGSETHTPGLLNASVVTTGYGYSSQQDPSDSHAADVNVSDKHEQKIQQRTNSVHTQDTTRGDHREIATPVAFVGSIGPQHMDYAATMAAVRAVARYLNAFIAQQ